MNEKSWVVVFGKSYDQIRETLVGFLPNLAGSVLIFLVLRPSRRRGEDGAKQDR